jgi:2-methylcitrate dehydratase PrpD
MLETSDPELQRPADPDPSRMPAYRAALGDWLACAVAGSLTPAAAAAQALGNSIDDRTIALGTAGHALDYDDTYAPGLTHVSAPLAPVALAIGTAVTADIGEALRAFARGWEASAAFARANHPDLRARGWHPTSVCGAVGAAVSAAALLRLPAEPERHAVRIALLRASGMRAAFGSHGKSLQVGFAAAAGAGAARLAAAGARVGPEVVDGPAGLGDAYGATLVLRAHEPAIDRNWIKAYPCCLQTHSAIEAALDAARSGLSLAGHQVTVRVHPVSLQAAAVNDVTDGLQAKFSIPYLTAYSYLRGAPAVSSFARVDEAARRLARDIRVVTDDRLDESEAVLVIGDQRVATVKAAVGSPARPMTAPQLAAKVKDLGAETVVAVMDDPQRPVADLLAALEAHRPSA